MSVVASRDLRNHTAEVLRQVAQGEQITVTVNGTPVAEISPVRARRRMSLSRGELIAVLERSQADPGLRADLRRLAGESTEDLGPIR